MNINGIIRMVLRVFLLGVVNKLVHKAIDWWARRGKPREELSAGEQARVRETSKKARDTVRIARRLGRF
jgi:hypothetical protein